MTLLILLFTILFPGGKQSIVTGNAPIRINVTNVSTKKGNILVALYNSDKGFPGGKEGAIRTATGLAQNEKCLIVIDNVVAGNYAVALFHDTNGDSKLNSNFLGIPKEGYGFSNNAANLFSAPKFKQAAFIHGNVVTDITIQMKY